LFWVIYLRFRPKKRLAVHVPQKGANPKKTPAIKKAEVGYEAGHVFCYWDKKTSAVTAMKGQRPPP